MLMTSTALNEVQSGDPQAIGTVINRWLQKEGHFRIGNSRSR